MIIALGVFLIMLFYMVSSYNSGYKKGYEAGVDLATNRAIEIIQEHINR